MKLQADKHRSEREFQPGDWVYLLLQPYRQKSMALRRTLKLAPRFYGSGCLYSSCLPRILLEEKTRP